MKPAATRSVAAAPRPTPPPARPSRPVTRPPNRPLVIPVRSASPAAPAAQQASGSEYQWTYQGRRIPVPYDVIGRGPPGLMLPAMSTVSLRSELAGLAQALADRASWTVPDWPGFGESSRPPLEYGPDVFREFLADFASAIFDGPVPVVAAGHAAGFALELGRADPGRWSRIVLVAPTWMGPFRAMGMSEGVKAFARGLIRSPVVGEALYGALTTPDQIRAQYASHVMVDRAFLTDDFVARKQGLTRVEGARFAPSSFITGYLDPFEDREGVLDLARSLEVPVVVVVGEDTPRKSKAEMEALGAVEGVEVRRVRGSLGVHEEFPREVAEAVLPFLS
ncbi:unnamed protein product [Ostreobium quekettii]|uniref:AB hydrolase-1 domain-containing protein n=1 Tax=Ostreobium quekettii TaxID=121088 RepID=A0A8S1JC55_9CHLO|nr:unnamed protein product [Ostreobium quekettii]|eukprot:evm.model.scf_812.4 EVM.evm.TU.scf_812.4   scf_812:24581-25588(-)